MPLTLARQLRAVLDDTPDAPPLDELLALVDDFVLQCSTSEEPETIITRLEEELQAVHHDVFDYSNLRQGEQLLTTLHRLSPILPSTTVISWFDLLFRPALRDPRLATTAVNCAKDLIVQASRRGDDVYSDKIENYAERVAGFRKRLFDLYLLDAFNVGSEGDVLEWAELDEEEREKRTRWKASLEDILVRYGQEDPEDFFTEILDHFSNPSARLQLFMLLNILSSHPGYSVVTPVLSTHALLDTIILSIFLDNSSTTCGAALTFLAKSLPYFAVYAREQLRLLLPRLLAVLARVLCWKGRYPTFPEAGDGPPDPQLERELAEITQKQPHVRPNIQWQSLEMIFNATASHPPDSRPFFSILFYLYPSNVLKFLRNPTAYLTSFNVDAPYVESWKDAFDEDEIRRKSENLLREHICHPLLIWKDASKELSTPEFWSKYGIPRIVSEAMMLDVRNLAAGLRERYGYTSSNAHPPPSNDREPEETQVEVPESAPEGERETSQADQPLGTNMAPELASRFITPLDLSTGKTVVSLSDMVQVTNALKANIDVDVLPLDAQWAPLLPSRSPSPSKRQWRVPVGGGGGSAGGDTGHVAQAISGLQREVLLLRNELNFELWVQRENVKHIGRLYQDRVLMKTAEAERQGLYNKLRKYRAQVVALENELREHKQQASSAKNKYADWNTELQKKLKELREEKKGWISESAALRGAEKEARALFDAQAKLLAEAVQHVIELQTQKKENQHKIDRLRDYERQIEQHIKIQKLWDQDYAKFNARADELVVLQTEIQRLKILLESYEKTQAEMEETSRNYRRQIQSLEAKIAWSNKKKESARPLSEQDLRAFVAEKTSLTDANKKLREENSELRDEIEELRAMVEVLKAQHTGRKGLVSEPRSDVPVL